MIREAIASGNTIEEAKEAALNELGIINDTDTVEFEVISMPQKKTFGLFGGSPAKIRAYIEVEDPKPVVKKEAKKEAVKKEPARKEKKPATPIKKAEPTQKREVQTEKKPVDMNNPKITEAKEYLNKILTNMGVENLSVEAVATEGGVQFNFDGDNLGVAIGRKGETLDSIQHLISLSANRTHSEYVRVTLNPGGYREKREQTLEDVANRSAAQAVKSGRNVILDPMNSYERRIIHNVIQDVDGVTSWSIGENENRRICIGNKRENSPFAVKNYDRRDNGNRARRPKTEQKPAEQEANRGQKTDSESTPLYGKLN